MNPRDFFPDLIAVHSDASNTPAHLFRPAAWVAMCGAPINTGGAGEVDLRGCCIDCMVQAAVRGFADAAIAAHRAPVDDFGNGYDDDRVEGSVRDYDTSDIADRLRSEYNDGSGRW